MCITMLTFAVSLSSGEVTFDDIIDDYLPSKKTAAVSPFPIQSERKVADTYFDGLI